MKQNLTYNRTVQYINKVFKLVNADWFEGELEMPTITIQSTVGAYGHVSVSKTWVDANGNATHELNLGADYLMCRPIEDIVATLIHEGCHLLAMQRGIRDTSNRGVYHNKRFKELGESHGLLIERHEKYGWTITAPSDELVGWCIENDLQDIKVTRQAAMSFAGIGIDKAGNGHGTPTRPPKKKSSSIKWICPCCGTIIRSTKEVNIVCGDCGEKFIKA